MQALLVWVDILNRISFCNQAAAMHKAHIKQVKQLKYVLKNLAFILIIKLTPRLLFEDMYNINPVHYQQCM